MSNRRTDLIVPPHSVRYFPKGEHCTDAQPGDVLLVDHGTFSSDLILAGQRALAITEPEIKPFTWVTHNAFVRESDLVSEMGFKGYERRTLLDYKAYFYGVVHFDMSDEQRATTLAYDDACQGVEYGWAEFVPEVIDGLTRARFVGSWGSSIDCSTHVTLVMMGGGLFPDRSPYAVVPARVGLWVGADPTTAPA